jgi:hypothetical protein
MDRDDFIEDLKRQFADSITEAYLECEHEKGAVDYPALKDRIEKIGKAAKVDGLKTTEYHELVCCVLPHDIVESLYAEEFLSKAG